MPESGDVNDHSLNINVDTNGFNTDLLEISSPSQNIPLNYNLHEDGTFVVENDEENTARDITVTLNIKSTDTDELFDSLFDNSEEIAKSLVNASVDVIIAKAATILENDDTVEITLSSQLYETQNDILVVKDQNAAYVEEDDESITIVLK